MKIFVMEIEKWPLVNQNINKLIDGTPYDGKLSCTVWVGGKFGDDIKELPIDIKVVTEGNNVSVAQDPLFSADHTYGMTVDMRIGVDVIVGTKFGALNLT